MRRILTTYFDPVISLCEKNCSDMHALTQLHVQYDFVVE